jgi:hypothetical protein
MMAIALRRCFHNRNYGKPVDHHLLTVHFPATAPTVMQRKIPGLLNSVVAV